MNITSLGFNRLHVTCYAPVLELGHDVLLLVRAVVAHKLLDLLLAAACDSGLFNAHLDLLL